jgi:hypothetical protein
MKICLEKIQKSIDPRFKSLKGGASISNETFSLVYVIKEQILNKKQ